jgi:hypothetical protein
MLNSSSLHTLKHYINLKAKASNAFFTHQKITSILTIHRHMSLLADYKPKIINNYIKDLKKYLYILYNSII